MSHQQVSFHTLWGACQHVDCGGVCVLFVEGSDAGISAPCGLCAHARKDHVGRPYYQDGSGRVVWLDAPAAAISSIPAVSNSVPPTFHPYNQHNPSNNSVLSANSGSRNVRQRTSPNGQNGLGRAPPIGPIFGGAGSGISNSNALRAATPAVVAMISPPPIGGSNNNSSSSNSSLTVSPEQAEASGQLELQSLFPAIYTFPPVGATSQSTASAMESTTTHARGRGRGRAPSPTVNFDVAVLCPHRKAPSRNSHAWDALVVQDCIRSQETGNTGRMSISRTIHSASELRTLLEAQLPILQRVCARWPSDKIIYAFARKGNGSDLIPGSYNNVNFPTSTEQLISACNANSTSRPNLYACLLMSMEEALIGGASTSVGTEAVATPPLEENVHNAELLQDLQAAQNETVYLDLTGAASPSSDTAAQPNNQLDPEDEQAIEALLQADMLEAETEVPPIGVPLVNAPSPAPSATTSFSMSQHAESRYPGCRDLQNKLKITIYNTVESQSGVLDQLLGHVSQFSSHELYRRPQLQLDTQGIGADAVDVGGVFRHVTYTAVQEALRSTVGTYTKIPRFETLSGRFVPSRNQTVQQNEDFWNLFGKFLFWLLLNDTWAVGLHTSVVKYLLNEPIDVDCLRGVNDHYDALLDITDPEQDSEDFNEPGPLTYELRQLGAELIDLDLPPRTPASAPQRLAGKQKGLATHFLISLRRNCLVQMRAGFHHAAVLPLPAGLTTNFIRSKYKGIVESAEDFILCMAEDTNWNDPIINMFREVLYDMQPAEVTALQSWAAGNPHMPPQHSTYITVHSAEGAEWRLPFAHTCFAHIELQSTRYQVPYVTDRAAGAQLLHEDLQQACARDTQVLGAA